MILTPFIATRAGSVRTFIPEEIQYPFGAFDSEGDLEEYLSRKSIKRLTRSWSMFDKYGYTWFMPQDGYVVSIRDMLNHRYGFSGMKPYLEVLNRLPKTNVFIRGCNQPFGYRYIFSRMDMYIPESYYIYFYTYTERDSSFPDYALHITENMEGQEIGNLKIIGRQVDIGAERPYIDPEGLERLMAIPCAQYSGQSLVEECLLRELSTAHIGIRLDEFTENLYAIIQDEKDLVNAAIKSRSVGHVKEPSMAYTLIPDHAAGREKYRYRIDSANITVRDDRIIITYGVPEILFSEGEVYVYFPEYPNKPHPHIYASRKCCLGEYRNLVRQAAIDGDLDAMIQIVLDFLCSYNPDSALTHPIDIVESYGS